VLSIALGSGDTHTQKKILSNVTVLSLVTTLLFAIFAYIFADDLVFMMGGRGGILTIRVEYLCATLISLFFWVYGLVLNFIV